MTNFEKDMLAVIGDWDIFIKRATTGYILYTKGEVTTLEGQEDCINSDVIEEFPEGEKLVDLLNHIREHFDPNAKIDISLRD